MTLNNSRLTRCGAVFHWEPTTWADTYRDFTITGTPQIVDGALGKGCYFNGTSRIARTIPINGSTYTIALSIHADFSGTAYRRILTNTTGAFGSGTLCLRETTTANQIQLSINGSGTNVDVSAYSNKPTLFFIIVSGGHTYFYANGESSPLLDYTGTPTSPSTEFTFGGYYSGSGLEYWIGTVFNCFAFNRALSVTERDNFAKGDPFPYDRNIISAWDAGINPVDRIGGNNGTGVGLDSTNIVDGPFGRKALKLNGTDEYFYIPDNNSLDFSAGKLSLTILANPDNLTSYKGLMVKGSSTPSATNYEIGLNASALYFQSGSISNNFVTSTDLLINRWHVISLAISGNTIGSLIEYFLNGVSVGSSNLVSALNANSSDLRIGTYNPTGFNFAGKIAIPMIHRTAFTKIEAADIYNRIMDGAL